MKTLIIASLMSVVALADSPRIIYTKEFRGSVPPFVIVTVERNGDAVYREGEKDEYPIKFKLREHEAGEIFRLAEQLDRFSRPLESNLKVAHMGIKTFRLEDGATRNEVKFNYSLDDRAKALADWFERISESEQNLIRLERTVKYDKLGVNDALLQLQIAIERKRLVAAEQYLPLLDRVIKNDTYLHMARERAAAIADAIRAPQTAGQ